MARKLATKAMRNLSISTILRSPLGGIILSSDRFLSCGVALTEAPKEHGLKEAEVKDHGVVQKRNG